MPKVPATSILALKITLLLVVCITSISTTFLSFIVTSDFAIILRPFHIDISITTIASIIISILPLLAAAFVAFIISIVILFLLATQFTILDSTNANVVVITLECVALVFEFVLFLIALLR